MDTLTPDQKLQRLIDELNLDVESQIIDEIEAVLKDTTTKREHELLQLQETNSRLSNEILQKTREITLLSKINDYNYELIEANSSIANYEFPATRKEIDKSQSIFLVIQIKLDEMENLRIGIINESRNIQTAITNLTNKDNVLHDELNQLQEELNNPDQDGMGKDQDKEEARLNDGVIQKISLYRQLGIRLATMPRNVAGGSASQIAEVNDGDDGDVMQDLALEQDVIIIDNGEKANTLVVEPTDSETLIADYIWDNL